MGEGFARVITVVAILLTIGSLVVAVLFARRTTRIRIGFDLVRAAVAVGSILVMATLTDVATPGAAIAVAVVAGFGLGYAQGLRLEITSDEGVLRSKRNAIALALWGCGIVLMQIAGLASRAGAVQLGQTVAWFSACLGIGLIIGRQGPLEKARQATAASGTAVLIATALIVATAMPAGAADAPRTDEELCELMVELEIVREDASNHGDPQPGARDYDAWLPLTAVDSAVATCLQFGYDHTTGKNADYVVYLFASPQEARAAYQNKLTKTEHWYSAQLDHEAAVDEEHGLSTYRGSNMGTLDHVGREGFWWQSFLGEVLMIEGPLVVHGQADGIGLDWGQPLGDRYRDIGNLQEILVDPMAATVVGLAEAVGTGETDAGPPPNEPSSGAGDGTSPSSSSTSTPTSGGSSDDPIEPEDAAAQAIGGLIAAAAIGLISWGEAAAEIGQILDGTRNTSILDPKTGPVPSPPEADTVKDEPEKKSDPPKETRDPCLREMREYRKALSAWLAIQSQISSLENAYALLKNQIESGSESDFLGASFDVAMLGIDLRGGKPPTPGMFRAMLESAKQNYARSISKQLLQRTATGQAIDVEAITLQASKDATGLPDLVEKGRPTSGAFGTWFNHSITTILAANRNYDYLKFMDTLAEPGAVSDPEVMRLLEKSSHESFAERIGPWVGVATKYLDFYWKNQDWGDGVEKRNKMGEELTKIRQQIDELEYDLSDASVLRDGWKRDLTKCREGPQ